ncbi:MAG TPA: hypothetical protein VK488_15255 [Gaiellaceae bacterium]|nr:hypothetical protein [Gaiellaceae bacterium]
MSSSKKARLELRSPQAGVEFALLDARLQQVASGVGALDARVDPGLYQLEVRAGPSVESQLLKLGAGEVHRDLRVSLAFPSAAPFEGTTTSYEVQQRAAFEGSERVATETGPPAGIVLVVRNVRGHEATPVDKATTTRLTLLDQRLRPVARFRSSWQVNSNQGWASWSRRLEPGAYVLRSETRASARRRSETLDQSLWLSRGWQTLVFVPNTPLGPASGSASIHMTRLGERWAPGWDPISQESASALELALWGLREGRAVVSDDLLRLLLNTKFTNPMLGIVGAHSLLLEPPFNSRRFETVIKNLKRLLPEHPDVAALSWLGAEAKHRAHATSKAKQFPLIDIGWPPMLAAAYAGLVRLDAVARGGVAPGSLAEAIAPNIVVRGVWTSWRPVATRGTSKAGAARSIAVSRPRPGVGRSRKSAATSGARKAAKAPHRRPRLDAGSASGSDIAVTDAAAERVAIYVDEVQRTHEVDTRREAINASGHDQISIATGLPVASVERAIERLGNSWLSS